MRAELRRPGGLGAASRSRLDARPHEPPAAPSARPTHAVEDLLADFLGPAPGEGLDAKAADLLAPFGGPQTAGSGDDPLSGLLPPPAGGAVPPALQQLPLAGEQGSDNSPLSVGGACAGSGSVASHDTPTSSGARACVPARWRTAHSRLPRFWSLLLCMGLERSWLPRRP